jgi:hypothetical protein
MSIVIGIAIAGDEVRVELAKGLTGLLCHYVMRSGRRMESIKEQRRVFIAIHGTIVNEDVKDVSL